MYFKLCLLLLLPNSPFESLEAFLKPWALNFFQHFSNGLFGRSYYITMYSLFYFCPIFTYELCNIPLNIHVSNWEEWPDKAHLKIRYLPSMWASCGCSFTSNTYIWAICDKACGQEWALDSKYILVSIQWSVKGTCYNSWWD